MKILINLIKIAVFTLLVLEFAPHNTEMPDLFCSSVFAAAPPSQAKVKCDKCGKEIKPPASVIKTQNGKIYCSEKCFQATLPLCCVCGKIISGNFYKSQDGKNLYCSEKCLSSTWPACTSCGKKVREGLTISGAGGKAFFCNSCGAKPKCFCCDMPANCNKLNDGRHICPECARTSVMEEPEMLAIAKEVRAKMKEKLNIGTDHKIEFRYTDMADLSKKTPGKQDGMELGLYLFEETTERTVTTRGTITGKTVTKTEDERVTKKYTIYLLYGMTRNKLVEVLAHELAHDCMQMNHRNITDLKIKEGWAEYVAARVNSLYGRDYMNRRMEENPSDVYGGGYRYISGIAKKGDAELNAFLDKCDADSKRKK
ncbi:MAG: LIM domain-containing protein [Victivallales bacterium]